MSTAPLIRFNQSRRNPYAYAMLEHLCKVELTLIKAQTAAILDIQSAEARLARIAKRRIEITKQIKDIQQEICHG